MSLSKSYVVVARRASAITDGRPAAGHGSWTRAPRSQHRRPIVNDVEYSYVVSYILFTTLRASVYRTCLSSLTGPLSRQTMSRYLYGRHGAHVLAKFLPIEFLACRIGKPPRKGGSRATFHWGSLPAMLPNTLI